MHPEIKRQLRQLLGRHRPPAIVMECYPWKDGQEVPFGWRGHLPDCKQTFELVLPWTFRLTFRGINRTTLKWVDVHFDFVPGELCTLADLSRSSRPKLEECKEDPRVKALEVTAVLLKAWAPTKGLFV